MTLYARIQNGLVTELYTPPSGFELADCFTPDILDQFVEVPPGVSPDRRWTYANGSFSPPSLPPSVVAGQILAEKIAAGIAITCTGNPALNETFALDDTTLTQIGSVARDAASGLGLPLGIPVFVYPNLAGEPCTFTPAQIIATYKAMRDLLFRLNTQAAIMGHGLSPSWPTQSATID